ncbi:MAG: nuclear transport factor 2 family protein [Candidatus Aminicenantes bacterium]|nr:nuclear transport factor 2 family protein [Candidatus Aminicenantes bacterium]
MVVAESSDTPHAAYDRYVHAVLNRDYAQFARSVTAGETFHFIDQRGTRTDSRRDYLDRHRLWFGQAGWDIAYESPLIAQLGDTAYAMAVFHLRERGPSGTPERLDAYFTLVMVKENDEWRAVADIVTPIAPK